MVPSLPNGLNSTQKHFLHARTQRQNLNITIFLTEYLNVVIATLLQTIGKFTKCYVEKRYVEIDIGS